MSLPQPTPQLVQQARLNAGLKMREAAEVAGVADAQVWSKYENESSGKQIPIWRTPSACRQSSMRSRQASTPRCIWKKAPGRWRTS